MTIGSRIQALRKERGMSQEELANKLSVSRQTVSQWETGQTAPSIDNIYTLKDIFGVSFDALMSEQQTESPQKAPAAVIPHKHGEITYNPEDIKSATRIVFMPRILRTLFVAVLFYHSSFCVRHRRRQNRHSGLLHCRADFHYSRPYQTDNRGRLLQKECLAKKVQTENTNTTSMRTEW